MIYRLIVLSVLIIKNPEDFIQIDFGTTWMKDAAFIEQLDGGIKLVKVASGWYAIVPDWVYNLGSRFSKNHIDGHIFWVKTLIGLSQWRFHKYKNFRG